MAWYNPSTNSFEGSGTLGARNYESASNASSNSAAQAISQVAAFTGTNTGKNYNVGQSYVMNGDAYTAQADGTFRNTRTGQTLAGSSNSSTVTFFAAQGSGGSGPASAQVQSVTGGSVRSSGPGNAGAVTSTSAGTGTGPGKPSANTGVTATGARLKSPFGAGPGGAFVLSSPHRLFPDEVLIDTSMPNVEDWGEPRYGEPGELVFGTANMVSDLYVNDKAGNVDKAVKHVWDQSVTVRPGSAADHAIRFVEQASQANWDRFAENGFYADKVELPRDGGGWAPKW